MANDIHENRAELRQVLDRMGEIDSAAVTEGRDLNAEERRQYTDLERQAETLQARIERQMRQRERGHLETRYSSAFPQRSDSPPAGMESRESGAGSFARAVEEAGLRLHERNKVTVELRNVFPDIGHWQPLRVPGIQESGKDERFLWPFLNTTALDPGVTRIDDFRQSGQDTVTGDIERDLGATGTKADLESEISFVSEKVKTFAVTISDVPNQVLESAESARAFFESRARYALNQALDAHVLAQILAANPPAGDTGANLIEQVRYAIAAMRLTGSRPTLAVLDPTDAAGLDLFQHGESEATYMFPSRSVGVASPLWNLQVVEHATPGLDEVPMLIDPAKLGQFYMGSVSVDMDPYSGFKNNTTTIRLEGNAYYHVRDSTGAYTIEAVAGDGDGDGDGGDG